MSIETLAVFCGSRSGNNPLYEEHAAELGRLIALSGITLIYGGGNTGIMGAIANAQLKHGGKVIGVIPEILIEWEHQHEGLTELLVVEDMHTRKRIMYSKCDATVLLPGGFGSLDEFFEMLTWNQLKIHNKRIGILNTAGFYDHLIVHMKSLEMQGFLYDKLEDRIFIADSPEELFLLLQAGVTD
jgi:uncharacterized protein (TIGR00730 family)